MRVLAVIPGNGKGHGMVFVYRQLAALEALGVSIHRFNFEGRTSLTAVLTEWKRLRREIAAYSPDVVHAHYGTITAFLAVCATRLPVVVTYRGSDLNPVASGSRLRIFLAHILSQLAAIRARCIISVSKEVGSRLLFGIKKVTVIPGGVSLASFYPISKKAAREYLRWAHDDLVVLFNAGCSPIVKGQKLAEASVELARRARQNLKLVTLCGDVPPEELPYYHNAADVLLLTSVNEGSPNIVKEAVACGLPVVSVDVGDVAERLHSVRPSRIVSRNPEDIANAILELVGLNVRSNGPEIAAKEFSQELVASKTLDVLNAASGLRQHSLPCCPESLPPRDTVPDSTFLVYSSKGPAVDLRLPAGLSFYWWRPSLFSLMPPTLGVRVLGWWLFHSLGVFRNSGYAVLFIKDRGAIIHRSCVIPAYFRWPFMRRDDLQISSTFTSHAYRGKSLATIALNEIVRELSFPGRRFWYVSRKENLPSVVARKAGFEMVGRAYRTKWAGLRILWQLVLVPDEHSVY